MYIHAVLGFMKQVYMYIHIDAVLGNYNNYCGFVIIFMISHHHSTSFTHNYSVFSTLPKILTTHIIIQK